MWDERYNTENYAYGIQPNDFLAGNASFIPKGKILSLAEGEGRNAVFLAEQGYSVTAVDSSLIGLDKGRRLAEKSQVDVEFIHADLADYDLGTEKWDGIVSIFCPLPPEIRRSLYKKVQRGLKISGIFLLEAYRSEQAGKDTGGGSSVEVMQTAKSLHEELPLLHFNKLSELERNVVEGLYHTGIGAVVQAIATKER